MCLTITHTLTLRPVAVIDGYSSVAFLFFSQYAV